MRSYLIELDRLGSQIFKVESAVWVIDYLALLHLANMRMKLLFKIAIEYAQLEVSLLKPHLSLKVELFAHLAIDMWSMLLQRLLSYCSIKTTFPALEINHGL